MLLNQDLEGLLRLRGAEFESARIEHYHSVLLAYLQGDLVELERVLEKISHLVATDHTYEAIFLLTTMRYEVRTFTIREENYRRLKDFAGDSGEWNGEIWLVLSHVASALENHRDSRDFSLKAARELKQMGVNRRALRALMNAIASESCYRPEKSYIPDFQDVVREARAIGESGALAMSLLNLSREYQKMGAQSVAMKYAEEAVEVSFKNSGYMTHQMALAHRAHLHCQAGTFREATADAEMALACPFPEVHAAVQVLREEFPGLNSALKMRSEKRETTGVIWPMWRERRGKKQKIQLTDLEQKLIDLIARSPRSKSELIEAIYGSRILPEAAENRLNNLLSRIRKRKRNLIVLSEGRYRLSELPVEFLKAASLRREKAS